MNPEWFMYNDSNNNTSTYYLFVVFIVVINFSVLSLLLRSTSPKPVYEKRTRVCNATKTTPYDTRTNII